MASQNSSGSTRQQSPAALVSDSWDRLLKIIPTPPSGIDQMQASVDRLNMGVFRLVVMGEIKKGKSSFINALLGEQDLLPTDSDVATSTVYKLIWGPEHKYKVFFLEDHPATKNVDSPLEIQRDQIADYGTELGNPGNEKGVDFIGIEVPNPMLMDGLVIVDTPGVGGLYKEHKDITWNYAPNADAIFFILDSVESVIGQDEIDFLQELVQDVSKRVFFIQTKIDIPDAEQWQGWVDRNKEILSDALPEISDQLIYMPVSSKLKRIADERHSGRHLQRSGFIDVLGFLENRLKPAKTQQLARDTAGLIIGTVNDTYREMYSRRQIFQAESHEELTTLAREFKSTQKEFNEWYSGSFDKLCQDCSGQISLVARQSRKELDIKLDPMGAIHSKIFGTIRENKELSSNDMMERIAEFQQKCLHKCQLVINRIANEFQEQAGKCVHEALEQLVDNTYGDELKRLEQDGFLEISLDAMHTHKAAQETTGSGQTVRNAAFALGAGAGVCKLGWMALALGGGALLPFIIIGAGLATGAVWKLGVDRGREEALRKVDSEIQRTIQQAYRYAGIELDDMATSFSTKIMETFREIAQKRKDELKSRLEELEESKAQGSEQRKLGLGELNKDLGELSAIQKALMSVI
jgi:GTPase SAR1 family protein